MIDATLNQFATQSVRLANQIRRLTKFPAVVEEPLHGVEPLAWLRAQHNETRFLWGNRAASEVIVGVGVAGKVAAPFYDEATHRDRVSGDFTPARTVNACRTLLEGFPAEVRMFGGFSFNSRRRPQVAGVPDEWREFGQASFWLPRAFLAGGKLSIIVRSEDDVAAALEAVAQLQTPESSDTPRLDRWKLRTNAPDQSRWHEAVATAHRMFDAEVLEKIVLARRVDLHFGDRVDPVLLSDLLKRQTPACYHFCFQLGDTSFVGATPERLFQRSGKRLASEVVAGTRPRGGTPEEDDELGETLLSSPKDQLEHDIVRKSIRQRLHALVAQLDVDASASLLKLATKQHLYSSVEAELLPDVHDGELIERLHPTPAVGGYPTENALAEISRLEPFARGWYAAPVGWIGRDSIELAVAIRSGLVHNKTLSLYSGAGIVPGSDPSAEWDEIEHKISDFLGLFPSQ